MFALRHPLTAALSLAFLLAGLASCAHPAPSISRSQIIADMEKAGLKEVWNHRLPMIEGAKWVKAWRVGDSIYATTTDAHLIRLNATSGALAWDIEIGTAEYQIFRPADVPGDKYVLVTNRGRGFLVNKKTGDIALQNELAFAVSTDPIVVGNVFMVGGIGTFRAFYIDVLGGQKWNTPAPGQEFTVRPVVEGETILLATDAGRLWRVNTSTGDWVWKDRTTGGRVIGGLACDSRAVYVPSLDGKVYAFDMANGQNLWTRLLEGRLDRALLATRSDVLVPSTGKGIYDLGVDRGNIKWYVPAATEIGTIVRDRVWLGDAGGTLKAVSLDNGEVLANVVAGGTVITNTVDQLVLTITPGGQITAFSASK